MKRLTRQSRRVNPRATVRTAADLTVLIAALGSWENREKKNLKGGLQCYSLRWVAGGNRSPADVPPLNLVKDNIT
jgi:hypothetical protein